MHRPRVEKLAVVAVHAISQIVQSCLLVSENRELHSKRPKPGRDNDEKAPRAHLEREIRGRDVKSSGRRKKLTRACHALSGRAGDGLLFIGGERRMHVLTSRRFDRNHIVRDAKMRCGGCTEWRCIDGRYDGGSAVKPAAFHRRD